MHSSLLRALFVGVVWSSAVAAADAPYDLVIANGLMQARPGAKVTPQQADVKPQANRALEPN